MIDFEKVIREAATRNGVVLPKDDPAMLFAGTVNIMLEDLSAALAAALDKYQNEHEGIARRWRHDAEASAAKILNAALDAGREATANALNEGAAKVLAVVREESLAALLQQRMELDAAMAGIRRHTSFMLLASGAVLVAAIMALFI